jgi:hypothetical protein
MKPSEPEGQPPPQSGFAQTLMHAVLKLMQPLIDLSVRHGITHGAFSAALKSRFVEAANRELARTHAVANDSAVSILSGVHRRDLRQMRQESQAQLPASLVPNFSPSLAAEVVARWISDPAFAPKDSAQYRLSLVSKLQSPVQPTFADLAKLVSRDARPKSVLTELVRSGAVTVGDNYVQLNSIGFSPAADIGAVLELFSANLHDHCSAAAWNINQKLLPGAESKSFLEQAVYVDQLSQSSIDALSLVATKAWTEAAQKVLSEAQRLFDQDQKKPVAAMEQKRACFGVYFYGTSDEK